MYKVISKNQTYQVSFSDSDKNSGLINNKPFIVDKQEIETGKFHALLQNKGYNIEVVKINKTDKTVELKINNRIYTYQVKDKFDELLANMGLEGLATKKIKTLKAPMPGLVLEILVAPGNAVKKGDNLLVLEAMKMENMIKAPADAEVKTVAISAGLAVEKNQLLIEFK